MTKIEELEKVYGSAVKGGMNANSPESTKQFKQLVDIFSSNLSEFHLITILMSQVEDFIKLIEAAQNKDEYLTLNELPGAQLDEYDKNLYEALRPFIEEIKE